jgi:hypothetical protein
MPNALLSGICKEKERRDMYQPKSRDDLIPRLYRLAKALGIPMTRLVNHILEHGIARVEQGAEHISDTSTPAYQGKHRRKDKRDADTT